METKVEELQDNRVKVAVTVDAKEVDDRITKTYKDYAYRYNFPGFRRGKAPRPIIDNAVGPNGIAAVVTETLINESYPAVIDEEKIYPIGQPQFEERPEEEALVKGGQPFSFEFTVEVKPNLELSSYDPVEIELPVQGATEEEIEEQLNSFREHYGEFLDAEEDAALTDGGFAVISVEATDEEGHSIENIESEERLYGLGAGLLSADFDKELIGMKKGEEKSFTLQVPEDESSVLLAPLAGKPVNFTVTVKTIRERKLPELNDDFARDQMGFEDLEDLRKAIESSIEGQKSSMLPRMKESSSLNVLLERLEGEPPAAMVEDAESRLLQDFFTQLQRQGTSFDAYLQAQNLTNDQFKEDVKKQAADSVKQELALDAWARHAGMDATDEDIANEFIVAGVDNPQDVEEQWRREGRIHLVRQGVLRAKAIADVMDTAKVTEVDYAKLAKEKAEKADSGSEEPTEEKAAETPEEAPAEKPEETPAETSEEKSSEETGEEKAE